MKEKISVKQIIKSSFFAICFIAIGALGYWQIDKFLANNDTKTIVSETEDTFDLQLPGEVEKRTVTVDEITGKLEELNEWSTYSGSYQITRSEDASRYLLDNIRVAGTTNTISVECTVIVKVGFDMSDVQPVPDNVNNKIYITLPDMIITDSYIDWDTVVYSEENNILNPIEFSQYQNLFDEIEKEGISKAKEEEIYDLAKENAENLIKIGLSEFSDYEVVFN